MFKIGEVVVSTQGRDKGNYYLVKSITEKEVFVVDGNLKPFLKPKKKNPKHLQSSGSIYEEIFKKYGLKNQAINAEIKKTLNLFQNLN